MNGMGIVKKVIVGALAMVVGFSSCKHKPEDVIAADKKAANDINKSIKDYTVKHVDDLTSMDAATITGYYREEEVKKIYTERFGDKRRTFTEYYFDDGMLVYVNQQDYSYNKPNTYTEEVARKNNDSVWYDDKKTTLEVNNFYFTKSNKMIRWYGPKKEIPSTDLDFINKEQEIWAQAAILIKELKEQ